MDIPLLRIKYKRALKRALLYYFNFVVQVRIKIQGCIALRNTNDIWVFNLIFYFHQSYTSTFASDTIIHRK